MGNDINSFPHKVAAMDVQCANVTVGWDSLVVHVIERETMTFIVINLNSKNPVQFVFGGKAVPMIHNMSQFTSVQDFFTP